LQHSSFRELTGWRLPCQFEFLLAAHNRMRTISCERTVGPNRIKLSLREEIKRPPINRPIDGEFAFDVGTRRALYRLYYWLSVRRDILKSRCPIRIERRQSKAIHHITVVASYIARGRVNWNTAGARAQCRNVMESEYTTRPGRHLLLQDITLRLSLLSKQSTHAVDDRHRKPNTHTHTHTHTLAPFPLG